MQFRYSIVNLLIFLQTVSVIYCQTIMNTIEVNDANSFQTYWNWDTGTVTLNITNPDPKFLPNSSTGIWHLQQINSEPFYNILVTFDVERNLCNLSRVLVRVEYFSYLAAVNLAYLNNGSYEPLLVSVSSSGVWSTVSVEVDHLKDIEIYGTIMHPNGYFVFNSIVVEHDGCEEATMACVCEDTITTELTSTSDTVSSASDGSSTTSESSTSESESSTNESETSTPDFETSTADSGSTTTESEGSTVSESSTASSVVTGGSTTDSGTPTTDIQTSAIVSSSTTDGTISSSSPIFVSTTTFPTTSSTVSSGSTSTVSSTTSLDPGLPTGSVTSFPQPTPTTTATQNPTPVDDLGGFNTGELLLYIILPSALILLALATGCIYASCRKTSHLRTTKHHTLHDNDPGRTMQHTSKTFPGNETVLAKPSGAPQFSYVPYHHNSDFQLQNSPRATLHHQQFVSSNDVLRPRRIV